MFFIKQATTGTLKIGPYIDDTDGKTAETGLTITQADIRLSKNGGDFAQKTDATACTHDELGYYNCPYDATDSGTLGTLLLVSHVAGALPIRHEIMIMPANVWDSLFGADYLNVAVAEEANIDFGALKKASLNAAEPIINATALTAIVAAILAEVLEGSTTIKQAFTKLLAAHNTTVVNEDGTVDFMSSDGLKIRFTASEGATGRVITDEDLT